MKRFLVLMFVLAMALNSRLLIAEEDNAIDSYKDAKRIILTADLSFAENTYESALIEYKKALNKLLSIKESYSDWSSMILVEIQIDRCKDKIKEIKSIFFIKQDVQEKAEAAAVAEEAREEIVEEVVTEAQEEIEENFLEEAVEESRVELEKKVQKEIQVKVQPEVQLEIQPIEEYIPEIETPAPSTVYEYNDHAEINYEQFDHYLKLVKMGDGFLATHQYEKALYFYNKALKINGQDKFLKVNKGIALFKLGKVREALLLFKKIINRYPEFSAAYYNVADIYYSIEKLETSVDFYERAIKIDPEDVRSKINLGVVYVKLGNYNKALDLFTDTIDDAPDSTDIHYNLGVIYSDYLFDKEKAVYHYRKYLEINPEAKDKADVIEWIALLKNQ